MCPSAIPSMNEITRHFRAETIHHGLHAAQVAESLFASVRHQPHIARETRPACAQEPDEAKQRRDAHRVVTDARAVDPLPVTREAQVCLAGENRVEVGSHHQRTRVPRRAVVPERCPPRPYSHPANLLPQNVRAQTPHALPSSNVGAGICWMAIASSSKRFTISSFIFYIFLTIPRSASNLASASPGVASSAWNGPEPSMASEAETLPYSAPSSGS